MRFSSAPAVGQDRRLPEDCGYCSQSVHHKSGLNAGKLMDVARVLSAAAEAKAVGAQRFCMGAAWREPKDRDIDKVVEMVRGVRALGLETCMTLGMLTDEQTRQLKEAGLDYYNHNIDTSPENYGNVISTRTFQDRLDTLERVRASGISVCCGGIVGMGESVPTASASSTRWQRCHVIPRAYRSMHWCRSGRGARRSLATGGRSADRRHRVCPNGGGGADHDAALHGPSVGRAREYAGLNAGVVLHGGCQFDFHG